MAFAVAPGWSGRTALARHACLANLRARACTRIIFFVGIASIVAGCATFEPPKPWEKGDLARPSMRFDADPLAARAAAHVYQSKEGAAGGGTVGGGGCGCN